MLTRILDKLAPARSSREAKLPRTAAERPSTDIPQWKAGDTILDRYRVEEVHSGAMGSVYIAEHLGWKIRVAVKVPKAEVLAGKEGARRIVNEADNWVRMGMHPNIATCYYVLNINQVPYIFIEYVDGGDLGSWINAGRCRDPRTALSIAVQFCHGMEFTHARGIIHRDIKPQNILLTKNALVKITDFGIIQTLGDVGDGSGLADAPGGTELTVGFRGTPGYASPEQFADSHAVDERSDVFSFGVCLWLMFCGRKPYRNNAVKEDVRPEPVSGGRPFPPSLGELLVKVVAHEPDGRFQSFTELRHALNKVYVEMFRVQCPYMELDFADLEAENFNNRAVSLLELGKVKEGAACLNKALDINDTLPEAIYNMTLLRWKSGRAKTDHLLRQLEAARQRLPDAKILEALVQALKCDIVGRAWDDGDGGDGRTVFYPEYLLCVPKHSLDVFRLGQVHRAAQANVRDLLAKKRRDSCLKVLLDTWRNIGFRKDKVFIEVYNALIKAGTPGAIRGVIRLATIPGPPGAGGGVCYLPGTGKILSLSAGGAVVVRDYSVKKNIRVLDKYKNITCTALSPDGNYYALGGRDGRLTVLSKTDGRAVACFDVGGEACCLAFSPDGAWIGAGRSVGGFAVYSIAGGGRKRLADTGGRAVVALAFTVGKDVVCATDDGMLSFWTGGGRECVREVEAHAMPVVSMRPFGGGLQLVTCAADRCVKVWDARTGQCMKTIEAHEDTVRDVLPISGDAVVSACEDDIIKIWEPQTGECRQILDGRGDGVVSLAPGPKPHIFLSGRADGAVVAWMVVYDLEFA